MEIKTYRDKSLRVPAIIISIISGVLTVLILYVFVGEENNRNRNVTVALLGVPVGIMFATLLAAWLLIKRRTVSVDSLGARVFAKCVLNGLLLFADGGTFARSTGQKVFHLGFMAIGLYTVAVLLLPGGRRAFQKR